MPELTDENETDINNYSLYCSWFLKLQVQWTSNNWTNTPFRNERWERITSFHTCNWVSPSLQFNKEVAHKLRRWQAAIAQVVQDMGETFHKSILKWVEALPLTFPFIPEYYPPNKFDLNVKDIHWTPNAWKYHLTWKFLLLFLEFKKELLIPIKCNYVSVNS